jgi:hypothetical protein
MPDAGVMPPGDERGIAALQRRRRVTFYNAIIVWAQQFDQ